MNPSYDAIVVGAGPGGATVSTLLAREGVKVLLLDKGTFPRDKVCGDAISGKSLDAIRALGLEERLRAVSGVVSNGATMSGPYGDQVSIPFSPENPGDRLLGLVCAREVFDQLMFEAACEAGAEVRLESTVCGLVTEGGVVRGVRYRTHDRAEVVAEAPLVVGADGAYSVVARELGMDQMDERHYVAAVRAYYEGVVGFNDLNFIEIHFVDEAIPGYFWIFPMADGRANVGVGMLSREIKRRDVKLKALLNQMVNHPRFRDRFKHAQRQGPVKGWGLPLGSKPRTMAGDGWVLIGDAASLVDPFTGEGIGNAMVSGMKAAEWTVRAKKAGDYSARFLAGYQEGVMSLLEAELRISSGMQRVCSWKWLLNTLIAKASRSEEIAHTISCMFDDLSERKKLITPRFYWRVLTA